jgi:membrane protein DedA with SNARE-associated domain
VLDAAALWSYLGIFLALVGAGIGVPIPEELPVVTGGMMSGHASQDGSHPHWWIMLPVCIAGVVISDGLLYGIGRLWGPRLLQYRWVRARLLPPARLAEIESNFHKYGVKILLFARLLPGIRSPIFIVAGIMRLSFTRFLLADGIYAIPGVSLLFFLGFWFTDQFLAVVTEAERVRPLIIVVVLTAVITYLIIHFMRKPVTTGAPEELPPIISQVSQHMPQIVKVAETQTANPNHDGVLGRSNAKETMEMPLDELLKEHERATKTE